LGVKMRVFIENPAGFASKNHHDEKTLEFLGTSPTSRAYPYPYPYGFVVGTTAEDEDNVDCFVLTNTPLSRGDIVECDAIGLMEQLEDGLVDHNVLAVLPNQHVVVNDFVKDALVDFVTHVFDHDPRKVISAGRFLDAGAADAFVREREDRANEIGSVE
jgi:inorganic pyrophosphatase